MKYNLINLAQLGKQPPTMVTLTRIDKSFSHDDVVSAVEAFGKTKSVVLFRSRLEVCIRRTAAHTSRHG